MRPAVLADAPLAHGLMDLRGYRQLDGSRLVRETGVGPAYIDLLAPAPASRARHDRRAGRFVVDEFPGLQYALHQPPVLVDVEGVLTDGAVIASFVVAVPSLDAAITVKALATGHRPKDREDVGRLLAAASAVGHTFPRAPYDNIDVGRAATWLHGPHLFGADERLRVLIEEVVPRPPQRDPFPSL